MTKSFNRIYPLYITIDVTIAGIFLFIITRLNLKNEVVYFSGSVFMFFIWVVPLVLFFKKQKLYTTDRGLSIPGEISRVVISLFFTGLIACIVASLAGARFFSHRMCLEYFLSLCLVLNCWRIAKRLMIRRLIARGFNNINILVIGASPIGERLLDEAKKMPWWGFRIVGYLDDDRIGGVQDKPILGTIKDFHVVLKKYFIDEVIIAIPPKSQSLIDLLQQAPNLRVGMKVVAVDGYQGVVPETSCLGDIPLLAHSEKKYHSTRKLIKRLLDLILASCTIVLCAPIFVLMALLIKCGSKGPVLYVQRRVGLRGNIFKVYKFRSMEQDADMRKKELIFRNEIKDGIIFKMRNDPRITRVGRFLRKYSLDELPQLVNVLRGEMSIVGPRPPLLDEVRQYRYSHMDKLGIKPGMTGLSQVRGRSNLTFRKLVRFDVWYVNNWSLGLDFKIFLLSIPAILKRTGAY